MLIKVCYLTGTTMLLKTNNKSFIHGLILLSICSASGTVMAQEQSSFQLLDGVIVDKNIENIYVINPNSGLDSVSLQTGLVNWHSDGAALPIMVSDGQLLAQEENSTNGILSLKALGTDNGEQIHSKVFALPNDISAPIADGLEHQFKIKSTFDNNPNGEILWTYNYKLAQGMVSEDAPDPIKSYGIITRDNSRSVNNMTMQITQQAHRNTNKAVVGEYLTNLQFDANSRQFKSANAQHILVSNLKSDPSQWDKYTWDIYDINGIKIGAFDHSSSYSPFIVSGQTIVFVSQPNTKIKSNKLVDTPLTLQAVSLASGNVIWGKEVRDLRFKGVYPH